MREAFKAIILEVIDADDLDLEADPSAVRELNTDCMDGLTDAQCCRSIEHALTLKK